MEFSPGNPIVKRCLHAMALEAEGKTHQALDIFLQAWKDAAAGYETFMTCSIVARCQQDIHERLRWYLLALREADQSEPELVRSAYGSLYARIAECYRQLSDTTNAQHYESLSHECAEDVQDKGPFYHGTRADMHVGDLLQAGRQSNYKSELIMNHIYFTALKHGAGLAALLAKGEGPERVYRVEPTGAIENDPNVTNKKFPGNPTRSYRSTEPLRVVEEIHDWNRPGDDVQAEWKRKASNGTTSEIEN